MLWLRGCSKCGGDLFRDWDEEVPVISCIQCGRILTASEEIKYLAEAAPSSSVHTDTCQVSQAA